MRLVIIVQSSRLLFILSTAVGLPKLYINRVNKAKSHAFFKGGFKFERILV